MGNHCNMMYHWNALLKRNNLTVQENDFRHHKTVKNVIFIKNERHFGHNSLQNIKIANHHIFVGLKQSVYNIGGRFPEALASSESNALSNDMQHLMV